MSRSKQKNLVVVLGPTAVGKTEVGVNLARHYKTEVISADSRQFYKEMKIGTALPESEEIEGVTHHFLASLSIHDYFNVHAFEKEALAIIQNIHLSNDLAIMVGGSGLYLDAVIYGIDDLPDADPGIRKKLRDQYENEGLTHLAEQLKKMDPEYYSIVDLKNPIRIMRALEVCMVTGQTFTSLRKNEPRERDFSIIKIGLNLPREELFERIHNRVDRMMERGLLEEVKALQQFKGLSPLKTVGYSELINYLEGKLELEEAVEKIKTNTRRYAKRQLTWFKRDSEIRWFRPDEFEKMTRYIDS